MNNSNPLPRVLVAAELTIEREHGFSDDLAIKDRKGANLGSASEAGNKVALVLSDLSSGLFFPTRPIEVQDQDGRPVLWIERRGVLRRTAVTVRRPDRSLLGRLVGQTWATTLRNKGFWVEVDGQRVGEVLADKHEYRIVDCAGADIAYIETTRAKPNGPGSFRTTLRARPGLSAPLASLALSAAVLRHRA